MTRLVTRKLANNDTGWVKTKSSVKKKTANVESSLVNAIKCSFRIKTHTVWYEFVVQWINTYWTRGNITWYCISQVLHFQSPQFVHHYIIIIIIINAVLRGLLSASEQDGVNSSTRLELKKTWLVWRWKCQGRPKVNYKTDRMIKKRPAF